MLGRVALLALLPAVLHAQQCDSDKRFPNIEYLGGRGYDLIKGNPQPFQPNAFDPGWKTTAIFDMEDISQNRPYGSCIVPNAADVTPTPGCSYQGTFSQIASSSDLQTSLKLDVSTTDEEKGLFGLGAASFTASDDFQTTSKHTMKFGSVSTSVTLKCAHYKATLRAEGFGPSQTFYGNLSSDFMNDVTFLPTEVNASTLSTLGGFVERYGTHFATEVEMGGKATRFYTSTTESYSDMLSVGVDVSMGAKISAAVATASADMSAHTHFQSSQAFDKATSRFQVSCVGGLGCPPSSTTIGGDGFPDITAWNTDVAKDPVPMKYKLMSIDRVLTTRRFPNLADKIDAMAAAVYKYLDEHYCGSVPGCAVPPRDGYWLRAANISARGPDAGRTAARNASRAVAARRLVEEGGRRGGGGVVVRGGGADGARVDLGVGVLNEKLYAVGGLGNGGTLASVEVYDPSTNQWTAAKSMSAARYDPGVGVLNGKLYAVGGTHDGYNARASVEVYDPSANQWTAAGNMSTARGGPGVGVLNEKLYAVGGIDNVPLPSVEVYDPSTDQWTAAASMSTARFSPGVGVLNEKLYAVGGGDKDGNALASVEVYDPSTNQWTAAANMSTARYRPGVGVLNGKLYAVGGEGSPVGAGRRFASVEVYDPSTNQWAAAPSMSTARAALGVGVLNGKLYAVGGEDGDGNDLASVEAFRNASSQAAR